jgi:methylenetetrahydrofolate reductase (NADPH)
VRIDEIIAGADRPIHSFEFFPPRSDEGERNLRSALEELRPLRPDFASVTYGAAGSTRSRTLEVTRWLLEELEIEAMAHLSCVGASRQGLQQIIGEITATGVQNILALRGDPPRSEAGWTPHADGLRYSTELIELIAASAPSMCIGAACFPEVHPEASDRAADLRFLRAKVDAGASFLIAQLFFDNELYFRFLEDARAAGIEVPIVPGIMPITDLSQIKTITQTCGATIPAKLLEQLDLRGHTPEAVHQLGVAFAALQCADLLSRGAPGIHFYTLNRSPATRAIVSALAQFGL